MMTNTWDGQLCVRKETWRCWSTPTSFIHCAKSWVSNTSSDIWFWSTTVVYTGTSKQRWISWKYPHWELLIDMQSKLSRNSSRRVSGSSGLKICHNKSMAKETLTHITKDKERNFNHMISIPRSRKRRVIWSLIKTMESGVSSTTSFGTTPMNVTRNIHWWLSSKKKNQNLSCVDFS